MEISLYFLLVLNNIQKYNKIHKRDLTNLFLIQNKTKNDEIYLLFFIAVVF
jgi:hypothetical protein